MTAILLKAKKPIIFAITAMLGLLILYFGTLSLAESFFHAM